MKPMLAATVKDTSLLDYPLYASPKLDGIRALVKGGALVSRTLKPIPNRHVQLSLLLGMMEGLDGELIVGDPAAKDCFRATTSGVMSQDGAPKFMFYVFDTYLHIDRFDRRYDYIRERVKMIDQRMVSSCLKVVPQVKIKDAFALHQYEETMLEKGYEGVMLRSRDGIYKHGRSTMKEGYLMKLKRFSDSEAEILEVVELRHNQNEKTTDHLGRAKRSSHKAGKVAGGVMGALKVRDLHTGVEFEIGAGFTADDREDIWDHSQETIGRVVKYKYFPTGSKDKPRFPVFLGFRKD